MNRFKNLSDRQRITRKLLENELRLLQEQSYNPFDNTIQTSQKEITTNAPVFTNEIGISPYFSFTSAMEAAHRQLTCDESTKKIVGFSVNVINGAAKQLGIDQLPIKEVGLRHLRAILDHLAATREKFSNSTYNHYRSYLMMLYNELIQAEAIPPINIAQNIALRKKVKKKKRIPTPDELREIGAKLKENPEFRRAAYIYHHSGARPAELMRIQAKDVQLNRRLFKCLVKKGKSGYKEVFKVISNEALPHWESLLRGANPGDYIFSVGLKPGPKRISPRAFSDRWKTMIKEGLGIDVDFHALKHLKSTIVSNLYGTGIAAKINSHTSEAMVKQVYDVAFEDRELKKLMEVDTTFIPE